MQYSFLEKSAIAYVLIGVCQQELSSTSSQKLNLQMRICPKCSYHQIIRTVNCNGAFRSMRYAFHELRLINNDERFKDFLVIG